MLYPQETTRYEAMQDEWEDKQPQHSPCWEFALPSKGIYDTTTDESELKRWVQAAIRNGDYVVKNEIAPF